MRGPHLLTVALGALVPALLALPLQAQRAPRRPRLASTADTNDAVSYFQLGLERIERDPDAAAVAFYWAARLDPAAPQAWYVQYVAQLAHNPPRLVRYLLRETRTFATPEVAAIDSLRLRALALDPFVRRGLEEPLLKLYAREAIPRDQWLGRSVELSDPEQVHQMERYFAETDPYVRGLLSYTRGELREAVQYWGNALGSHESDWIWAERGAAFVELRQLDSARANLERAVERARGGSASNPRHPWETKAAFQVALGALHEQMRNWALAREAYENAAAANAAFYPASLRLGLLGLRTGDTASAVTWLQRELELKPDDYFAHATLGAVLNNRRQRDSAIVHLRRAAEIEPWSAASWLLLARSLDAAGDSTQAVATFERFLALAPRNDAGRLLATRRIEQLRGPAAARP